MKRIALTIISSFLFTIAAVATDWHTPLMPAVPSPASFDVQALTPWEMLGEDDGLGEIAEQEVSPLVSLRSEVVDYAHKYLGCRYVSGGKGPRVFDCSGFTSYIFRQFGMKLGASSQSQSTQGSPVAMKDLKVGDLMFFAGRRGGSTVGHVGMVVDVNQSNGAVRFIHAASGKGIVITRYPDGGYYSQRFLSARRVIES